MYLNSEERKKLQLVLESTIPTVGDKWVKTLLLLLMALIKDLDETSKQLPGPAGTSPLGRFGDAISQIMDEMSRFGLPEVIDEEYLKQFSCLAQNLTRLALKMNELQELLQAAGNAPKQTELSLQ